MAGQGNGAWASLIPMAGAPQRGFAAQEKAFGAMDCFS
jgi:hypothetical protein